MREEPYSRGEVVLVPFLFTDLSGRKVRPALVVSPDGLHEEDLILCAITSQLPKRQSRWETSLGSDDMVEGKLPKQSIIKTAKLFTMHRDLISDRFGSVRDHKLQEVLETIRGLFSHVPPVAGYGSHDRRHGADVRTDEVDDAVLALLYLNAFHDRDQVRTWKTFDRDTMGRLHERGYIGDPKSKAKSVPLTDEGMAAARESFRKRFAAP